MPRLVFLSNDRAPIALDHGFTLGRSELHADVSVDDKRLSRKHCEFVVQGEAVLVRDLGSVNGVRINGDLIKELSALKVGDEISLGGLRLAIEADPESRDTHKTIKTSVTARAVEKSTDRLELDSDPQLRLESDIDLEAVDEEPGPTIADAPSESPQALALLKVVRGDLPSPFYRIEKVPFVVGRGSGCDLVLVDDRQSSGKHAQFEADENTEGRLVLSDMNSTNGTKVEGVNIDVYRLNGGERVQIGGQIFRFSYALDEVGDDSDSALQLMDDDSEVDVTSVADIEDEIAEASEGAHREELARVQALGKAEVNNKGGSGGRRQVAFLEVLLALIFLGLVGFLIKSLVDGSGEEANTLNTAKTGASPLKAPSLLSGPWRSFESTAAGAGDLPQWSVHESSSTDELVPFEDSSIGGEQVLRVTRYLPESRSSVRRSVFICKELLSIEAENGLEAKFFARLVEGSPTLFFCVQWFETNEAIVPLREDVLHFFTPSDKWTEYRSTFVRPGIARFARVGLGLTGAGGRVDIDEYSAQRVAVSGSQSIESTQTLVHVGGGEFQLASLGDVHLRSLAFGFLSREGIRLDHRKWLHSLPVLRTSETDQTFQYEVFDPDRSILRPVTVTVSDGAVEATTQSGAGGLYSSFCMTATFGDTFQPKGMTSIVDRMILDQGRSIVANPASDVRATGMRNTRRLASGSQLSIQHQQLLLQTESSTLRLAITIDDTGKQEYVKLRQLASDSNTPLLERCSSALDLVQRFPADPDGFALADQTIEAVVSRFRVRYYELSALIEDSTLPAFDPDMFIRASLETTALRDEVVELDSQLQPKSGPVQRLLLDSLALTDGQKSALSGVSASMAQFGQLRRSFEELTGKGDDRAYALISQRQSARAEPILASAEDHLANGEHIQAQLKLTAILREFPASSQATSARGHLLSIVTEIQEREVAYRQEGLNTIAEEAHRKALGILNEIVTTSPAADMTRLNLIQRRLANAGWLSEVQVNTWMDEEKRIFQSAQEFLRP